MIFDWAILLGIRLIGLQVDVVRLWYTTLEKFIIVDYSRIVNVNKLH